MDVLLSLNPLSVCGTVNRAPAVWPFICVRMVFVTQEVRINRCVRRTLSGPAPRCHVEVIQPIKQTTGVKLNLQNTPFTLKSISKLCVSLPVPEVSCGDPATLPHTRQVWNGSSTPGSTVSYYCKLGFYYSGGHNNSVCTAEGLWTSVNVSCQGNNYKMSLIEGCGWFCFQLQ